MLTRQISFTASQYQSLSQIALTEKASVGEIVRQAVEMYLAEKRKQA